MKKPVTIQDVARAAGVSTATVSRALSSPDGVAEPKRRAVEAALVRTGYQINHAARNLRRQRTGVVVALVPKISNPFFSRILDGIDGVLRSEGMTLTVAETRPGGASAPTRGGEVNAAPLIAAFNNKSRADGVILLDGGLDWPSGGGDVPAAVYACEWRRGSSVPMVRAENARGAAKAVDHLWDIGHRRIGFVGDSRNVLIEERRRGVEIALARRGGRLDPKDLYQGDFSLDSGARAGARWLQSTDRPTAIVCANDEMAIGLIGAVARSGAQVPKDLSVTGFDDIDIARHVTPALTTLHQPRTALGRLAARTLVDLLAGREVDADQVLDVDLVQRDSTAPPRD